MDSHIKNSLECWIPCKLVYELDKVLVRWLYVNHQPFTDPFFDETILKCRKLQENLKQFKSVSEINILAEWAQVIDNVEPTAFIFHISRCGSTLVSQLLGMHEENISLSEVPVFDEILRMPLKHQAVAKTVDDALIAAIKFYAQKRNGKENRLFLKTDSWHLLFYQKLRTLYPKTPFIILYRNPAEVLFSQQRQKGMHAVRGLIEPAIFGFDEDLLNKTHPDDYMSLILEKYSEVIIEIAGKDQNCLLTNYNEGISNIMQKIARFVGIEFNDSDTKIFSERSRYHAKKGSEIFVETYPSQPIASPNLGNLKNLYSQIEKLRLQV